jgi:hypothetical protein
MKWTRGWGKEVLRVQGAKLRMIDLSYIPREARHNDDTNGVEDIGPRLPESARATLGYKVIDPITFARSCGACPTIASERRRKRSEYLRYLALI